MAYGFRSFAAIFLLVCGFAFAAEVDEPVEYVFFDETPVLDLLHWRIEHGDSAAWAAPAYNDEEWEWEEGSGLWVSGGGAGKGVRWYRKTLLFPEAMDPLAPLALYLVAGVSAVEIFWDGQLIARNGTVGQSVADEQPGLSALMVPIPSSLTTVGKHVVAMRMSNFRSFSGLISPPLQLGVFSQLQERVFQSSALSLFLAGIFVITALFHIAILLGHANKWTYALFGAFCLSCAGYIIIRSMLHYFRIDLGNYYTMAALNDVPWFLMMSLLPIFFLFEFSFPGRLRWSILIVCVTFLMVVPPRLVTFGLLPVDWLGPLDRANRIHAMTTIIASVIVSLWAIRRRRAGSLTVALGLFIFLMGAYVSYRNNVENGWSIGFAFLILVITVSLSRQMAQRSRTHQEAQLRSARLELELLKRHIQPHFLLNSLNSIVAWLEEEPGTAARLVNALAEELRMLLDFSGRQVIALTDEIRLCEAHIKVMSLRQEKEYVFETEGMTGDEKLPPLVIHTLVENGLTHGYQGRDRGRFVLRCEHIQKRVRYVLFNDSVVREDAPGYVEGTGLRYVRSRLEEAFPGRWELHAGPADGGWHVVIEIEKDAL